VVQWIVCLGRAVHHSAAAPRHHGIIEGGRASSYTEENCWCPPIPFKLLWFLILLEVKERVAPAEAGFADDSPLDRADASPRQGDPLASLGIIRVPTACMLSMALRSLLWRALSQRHALLQAGT
jgi:hypothetical protein